MISTEFKLVKHDFQGDRLQTSTIPLRSIDGVEQVYTSKSTRADRYAVMLSMGNAERVEAWSLLPIQITTRSDKVLCEMSAIIDPEILQLADFLQDHRIGELENQLAVADARADRAEHKNTTFRQTNLGLVDEINKLSDELYAAKMPWWKKLW